jgi:hypothetical protein
MSRYQDVDFRDVDDLIGQLPEDERKIVERLRSLVLECIPDAKEKLSYNVPFYSRFTRICYIWPGFVPWGSKRKKGVDLGFCRGSLLSDTSYLDINGRKEVFTKTFYSTRDIDAEKVRQLLYEAALVDEERHRMKKKTR